MSTRPLTTYYFWVENKHGSAEMQATPYDPAHQALTWTVSVDNDDSAHSLECVFVAPSGDAPGKNTPTILAHAFETLNAHPTCPSRVVQGNEPSRVFESVEKALEAVKVQVAQFVADGPDHPEVL